MADAGGLFQLTDLPGENLRIGFLADMDAENFTLNDDNVIDLGYPGLAARFSQTDDAKRMVVADRGDGIPEIVSDGFDDFMETLFTLNWSLGDVGILSIYRSPIGTDIVSELSTSADVISGWKLLTTADPRSLFNGGVGAVSQKQFTLPAGPYHAVYQEIRGGLHANHRVFIDDGTEASYGADISNSDPGLGLISDRVFLASRAGGGSFLTGAYGGYGVWQPALSDANRAVMFAGIQRFLP